MYERFTDRARKVMQLANQEAQKLNHEYVGTEHMLLGLTREDGGIAAHMLKRMNLEPDVIRNEVHKLLQPGPEMVTMGKLPQTPRAKKVIDYALEEAKGGNYVGTEHILLGLIREQEGIASQVLCNLGASLNIARVIRDEIFVSTDVPPEMEAIASALAKAIDQRTWKVTTSVNYGKPSKLYVIRSTTCAKPQFFDLEDKWTDEPSSALTKETITEHIVALMGGDDFRPFEIVELRI